MPLADVLTWLQTTSRSGTLTIRRDAAEWELRIEHGRVVGYYGPELHADKLGHIVVTSGLLTEDDLRQAMQHHREKGESLARSLVQRGFLSQANLDECLKELATESLYDMFLELPGEFVYSDASEQALALELDDDGDFVALSLSVNHLLMEGARRHDEWQNMRQRFPTEHVSVKIVYEKLPPLEDLGVRERRLLASLASGQNMADLCLELRAPLPSLLLTLSKLAELGAVLIRSVDPSSVTDANRIETLVRHAQVLRQASQIDEAVNLLEVAVKMRPDADDARDSLREAMEEQLRALYRTLPPLKIPRVIADERRLQRLKLRPEERFLVDRLAAQMDIGSLIMVSSLDERSTLKFLKRLLHGRIIELS